MSKVLYDSEDIQRCLDILNEVTITGIRNCEKIAVAANILMNPLPEKEEDHGSDSEGE